MLLLILLTVWCHEVESLEPVTTGISVGVAAVTSVFFAGYNVFRCTFGECCESSVRPNITGRFPVVN